MPRGFQAKKEHILSSLQRDGECYTDLSPKGSVDAEIRELVNEINQNPGFITTSSCSGRIAVYLEGAKKAPYATGPVRENGPGHDVSASAGGKGGGKWLFTSHQPLHLESLSKPGELLRYLGLPTNDNVSFPASQEMVQYVHFKFEPMILHILCSSSISAQKALSAALSAGFRESGLSSITTDPMIAVRTSGLSLDSLIGYQAANSPSIQSMVTEEYLGTLVIVANERFAINQQRMARFRTAFLQLCSEEASKGKVFEPSDIRRERKRREGLERKQALLQDNAAVESKSSHAGAVSDLDSFLSTEDLEDQT